MYGGREIPVLSKLLIIKLMFQHDCSHDRIDLCRESSRDSANKVEFRLAGALNVYLHKSALPQIQSFRNLWNLIWEGFRDILQSPLAK